MKAGDKARLIRNLRFESQRFRLLSIVIGCFLISVTFLVSSRPEANVFNSLSPEGSLDEVRRLTSKQTPTSTSPSEGLGEDFQVDIVHQQEDSQPKRVAEESKPEWTNDKVEERTEQAVVEEENVKQEANDKTDSDESSAKEEVDENIEEKVVSRHDEMQKVTQPTVPDRATDDVTIDSEQTEKKSGGVVELETEPPKKEQKQEDKQMHSGDQLCDFSDFRTNICDMQGDLRMNANASTFVFVDPTGSTKDQTYKIRPYPRKGDDTCMSRVTEITVRTSTEQSPQCTMVHTAPGVVFSIGGYTGNIFHDFSDVIVPLFHTVQRYNGDVQLIMTNVASWWLIKYDKLLRALSLHQPLDFGKDNEVHCFSHVVLSLRAHKELIIERERSPDGLATPDFTQFIRGALSLDRDAPTRLGEQTDKKPRLLIISRRRTRLLLNLEEIVQTARDVGFDVIVNESDVANDITQVGQLINSCDVMIGVHGAGLTNMMFLPPNATMIQIVPWGGLQWIARMDYGEPAMAMGLKYIEYDISIDESSLIEKYPRDHEIFKNPTALHKKGFLFMKETLMDGQNIKIDMNRFKGVLLQALDNLGQ